MARVLHTGEMRAWTRTGDHTECHYLRPGLASWPGTRDAGGTTTSNMCTTCVYRSNMLIRRTSIRAGSSAVPGPRGRAERVTHCQRGPPYC